MSCANILMHKLRIRPVLMLVGLVVALGVYGVAALSHMKFERKLLELTTQRIAAEVGVLEKQISLGLSLGLALEEMEDASKLVTQLATQTQPARIYVVDQKRFVLHSSDFARIGHLLPLTTPRNAIPIGGRSGLIKDGEFLVVSRALVNSFGLEVGSIELHQPIDDVRMQSAELWSSLRTQAIILATLTGVMVFAGLHLFFACSINGLSQRQKIWLSTGGAVTALVAISAILAWTAYQTYRPVYIPELERKAETISRHIAADLEHAVRLGIPLAELPGLENSLQAAILDSPYLTFAAVADSRGRILFSTPLPSGFDKSSNSASLGRLSAATNPAFLGLSSTPLFVPGGEPLQVVVGSDDRYARQAARGLSLDILAVSVVAVMLVFEILLLAMGGTQARHMGTGDASGIASSKANIGDGEIIVVRTALLLFCLAEELTRPFIITHVSDLMAPSSAAGSDWRVSLPITVFMLCWAFVQPFGARISQQLGRRRTFVIAATVTAVGYLLAAMAKEVGGFLLARALSGFGYGLAFISAHGAVIDRTSLSNRASGMALLVGAILAAGVCGPVLGGLIADEIGAASSFLASAALALCAAGLWRVLERTPESRAKAQILHMPVARPQVGPLLRNPRFAALMLLSAIPTKIASTGIVFCLVPVLLGAMEASSSDIGRVQMIYFLAFMLAAAPLANLADRLQKYVLFIVFGGGLTLLAVLPAYWVETSALTLLISVLLFGVAQSTISSPQLTLVSRTAHAMGGNETHAVAWYRLIERIGGACGPVIALTLVTYYSPHKALVVIGLVCASSALAYLILSRWYDRHIDNDTQATKVTDEA